MLFAPELPGLKPLGTSVQSSGLGGLQAVRQKVFRGLRFPTSLMNCQFIWHQRKAGKLTKREEREERRVKTSRDWKGARQSDGCPQHQEARREA